MCICYALLSSFSLLDFFHFKFFTGMLSFVSLNHYLENSCLVPVPDPPNMSSVGFAPTPVSFRLPCELLALVWRSSCSRLAILFAFPLCLLPSSSCYHARPCSRSSSCEFCGLGSCSRLVLATV
eukprot:Gb_06942 [translate_table: standard]